MTREQIEELARAERRGYHKAWRAANPDKVKKHALDYWKRKAEKRLDDNRNGGNENAAENDDN